MQIPRATYRVQLNAGFTFAQLTAIVPYLATLGVSHVYCSPYFRARPGSVHGYDVVDHNAFNPEIGSRDDFERLVAALRAHGLGHVLDIVPNHVGIMGAANEWWMDVLENGPASPYAGYFDIEWSPANPALAGRLLVPVLGDPYGVVLERGELEVRYEEERGGFALYYHEHRLPLDPCTYPRILDRVLAHVSSAQLEHLRRGFATLPARDAIAAEAIPERAALKAQHQRALAQLVAADGAVRAAIAAGLASLQGTAQEPASFDSLDELLQLQAWRLAWWRVAADDINYRRFFDVNDLAALRVENPQVFEATHRLLLELVAASKVDGLRVDHVDGLYDPAGYVRRLQRRVAEVRAPGAAPAEPRAIYLVVEKITAAYEHLPSDWPVHGETGYHFANVVNRLLVDPATRSRMDHVYRAFIGERPEWPVIAYECQHAVLRSALAAELSAATQRLERIALLDRRTRDFTFNALRRALAEIIACFPVYRTYIDGTVHADDRRYIEWAVTAARRHRPVSEAPVFDFVREALLLERPASTEEMRSRMLAFVMRLQQITAPVTAKGIEDTALYRFCRLTSLDEVGGEPEGYGLSVGGFHADAQYRNRHWPHELLATSTHDTKRSEDVRARIDVLSEAIVPWRRVLERWSRLNRLRRRSVGGEPAPSRNDEYLLYQTLLGSWPLDPAGPGEDYCDRIEAYMLKAAREAKLRTSWATPDPDYEAALSAFVRGALEARPGNAFVADLDAFARWLARFGLLNALSQTLLKLTAPGVPDIYQGNELWDFSLVDPDNRRPVDYARRQQLLEALRAQEPWGPEHCRALLERLDDGRCKLLVVARALALRRRHPQLFSQGAYRRLRVRGRHASNVCAFAREHAGACAISIAPRLYRRLLGNPEPPEAQLPLGPAVWGDTRIELPGDAGSPAVLEGVLDGTRIELHGAAPMRQLLLGDALRHFPVALLTCFSDSRAPAD